MPSATADITSTLLPPQDLDSEQMVLGACIINQRASLGIAKIRPDDFYKGAHRVIFSAMQRLHERGDAVDIITLSAELEGVKGLEGVGLNGRCAGYLAELVSLVPTAANYKYHERIVMDRARQRDIIHICREGFSNAQSLKEPDEAISDIIRKLTDLRRNDTAEIVTHRDVVLSAIDYIQTRFDSKGVISGIPTGFRDLDHFLDGLQPEYYVLGGRPSMGKTAFAEGIIHGAASHFEKVKNGKVGFISIEMGKTPLGLRALSRAANIPLSRLRHADLLDRDWNPLSLAAGKEYHLPIVYAFSATNVRQIKSIADDMVHRMGCKMIVVDYLQLMSSDSTFGTREQEVSSHSRMFKNSVTENKVPYIILSQLNRGLENRPEKRPMSSDLRESGSLEQDADVIMMCYRDEVYHCKCPESVECSCGLRGKAEIIVTKGRNQGLTTIHLQFDKKYTRFRDKD